MLSKEMKCRLGGDLGSFNALSVMLQKIKMAFYSDYIPDKNYSFSNNVLLIYENFAARVLVGISLQNESCRLQMSLLPAPESAPVQAIIFPALGISEPSDFIFPAREGIIIKPEVSVWKHYPGELALQCLFWRKARGGMLIMTADRGFSSRLFGFSSENNFTGLKHFFSADNKTADLPTEITLYFTDHAWEKAAEIYRNQAAAKGLLPEHFKDRKDIPAIIHKGPLVLALSEKNDPEKNTALTEQYTKHFSVPVISCLQGLEKYGSRSGIDFLPPASGSEQVKKNIALYKKNGIICTPLHSWRWLFNSRSFPADKNHDLLYFFNENNGPDNCITGKNGMFQYEQNEKTFRIACPASSWGRDLLGKNARELISLGFNGIFLTDNQMEYLTNGCYNKTHGHNIPQGASISEARQQSYMDIKRAASDAIFGNFLLAAEFAGEKCAAQLHTWRSIYGTGDTVPFVSFVLHEYLPSAFNFLVPQENTGLLIQCTGSGAIPGIALEPDKYTAPDLLPPSFRIMLEDYYSALSTWARDFLLYGKRIPGLQQDTALSESVLTVFENDVFFQSTVKIPAFVCSAWEYSGKIAWVAAARESGTIIIPQTAGITNTIEIFTGKEKIRTIEISGDYSWSVDAQRFSGLLISPLTAVQ
ncbi:MAG TPA: hypothetical protein DC049_12880 [Spirochaetia bacterium]|nr:hypothetical protein [Spirochaetia bacterium]